MIEGIYERKCRSAIKCSTIIERGRNVNRCLVDVWNTKIDFPHVVRRGYALNIR